MKFVVYGTFALLGACCVCFSAPEPAIVQGPLEWTLDVKLEPLNQILYPEDGAGEQRRFWYTIATVTNEAGKDVDFVPRCDLMTDTFQVIPAGKDVNIGVFEGLQDRYELKYPLLEYLELTDKKVLEGRDNTKDLAIIWPDFDARAKQVKIFIGGLSNKTVVIDHPIAKDADGNPEKIYLRKTLEVTYEVAGDPAFRSEAKVVLKGQRWVMR
jgi:hypothetical protein